MSEEKHQGNAIFAGLILSVILTWVGINSPDFWLNAFLMVVAWAIATLVARRFVSEERGLLAYIIYFAGILIASIVSELSSKAILAIITMATFSATDPRNFAYFFGSIVMCLCVYYTLQSEIGKKTEEIGLA